MHLYVHWDIRADTTPFKREMNKLFRTMFKFIANYLISLLVNLSCELGKKITIHRFIGTRRVILT